MNLDEMEVCWRCDGWGEILGVNCHLCEGLGLIEEYLTLENLNKRD